MSLSPEEIDNLVEELTSVDPSGGYPDGYDGRVLDAIGAIIASDGDAYTDNECLGMIHQLVNHWSEVVDL